MPWSEMPRLPGHAFYDRLQPEFVSSKFDGFVRGLCVVHYAALRGCPSLTLGHYFWNGCADRDPIFVLHPVRFIVLNLILMGSWFGAYSQPLPGGPPRGAPITRRRPLWRPFWSPSCRG